MKTYVLVGAGGRSEMFTDAFMDGRYKGDGRLLALCDSNKGRLAFKKSTLENHLPDIRYYAASQFDEMIQECKPNCVIVCTPDCTHDEYICRSLHAGCDVVTEKPLTIDAARCQKILDVVKSTGRNLRITFNYRYSPVRSQVKKILMEGTIGNILSVDFQWILDTNH